MLFQVLFNGLVAGSLYALVALGFSLIYSATRIFHIAHGAIYTAAAYSFLLWVTLFSSWSDTSGWGSFVAALTLTLAVVCLFAILCELIIYRPLYRRAAPPLVSFISSLGLYIVAVNLIALAFGSEKRVLNPNVEPGADFGPIVINRMQAVQLAVSALVMLAAFLLLKRTTLGRNIRALSDNAMLLGVLGVNPKRVRTAVFILGSVLAALAALLRGFDVGMNPYGGLIAVLTATVAIIIGGIGSNLGAICGAMFIGLTQNFVVWFISSEWKDAATFVVLIAVLLYRREGVFARQARLEEG
jgi:branched-chain amino acid transport system permease protein